MAKKKTKIHKKPEKALGFVILRDGQIGTVTSFCPNFSHNSWDAAEIIVAKDEKGKTAIVPKYEHEKVLYDKISAEMLYQRLQRVIKYSGREVELVPLANGNVIIRLQNRYDITITFEFLNTGIDDVNAITTIIDDARKVADDCNALHSKIEDTKRDIERRRDIVCLAETPSKIAEYKGIIQKNLTLVEELQSHLKICEDIFTTKNFTIPLATKKFTKIDTDARYRYRGLRESLVQTVRRIEWGLEALTRDKNDKKVLEAEIAALIAEHPEIM